MKNKIIIVTTAVLVSVILLLFNLYSKNENEVVERFKTEQTQDAQQLAFEIESFISRKTQEIKVLANLPSIKNKDINGMAEDVKMFYDFARNSNTKGVTVYDESGTIIYSTFNEAVGRNYSNLDFFQWAAERENKDKGFISSQIRKTNDLNAIFSNFRFLLAIPIYRSPENINQSNNKDKFAGIITATIGLEEIVSEFFPRINPDDARSIFIFENNGNLLYHSKHPEMVLKNVNFAAESCYACHISFDHYNSILSGKKGSVEYSMNDGEDGIASYSSINIMNISWKVILRTPYKSISEFVSRNYYTTLLVIVIIAFLLIAGFIYISHINKLMSKADEEAKNWKEKSELEYLLEENEEQFKLLYQNSPIGLYRTSPSGEIILANNKLVEMLGHSSFDELYARNLEKESLSSSFQRNKFVEEIEKNGKIENWEDLWQRKDGSYISIRENARVVRDENGNILYYDGTVEDITEQKRLDLERQVLFDIIQGVAKTNSLDELLELIHESLGKVVYVKNYFVALYNESTQLFGFPYFIDKYDEIPEPSALHKSCTAYIFKTGKPLLLTQKLFDELVEKNEVELVGTNSPSFIGVPLSTPAGTIGVLILQHYEEENVYSERDVEFLTSVGSQIAAAIERKRAEDELRESENMFRKLFDKSTDPILLLDDSGFINCNESTVLLLGYSSKEEFLNKKPWELSPERQPDGELSSEKSVLMINKSIKNGFNRFEWIHTKSDGSDLPVEVMLTPIQLKGKKLIYTVWRDITDRMEAEKELQNERLLLRTVIDNIPDAIYSKDTAGRKTLANITELSFTGLKSESEILGKTDFDLYPKDIAQGFFEDDKSVIQSGKPVLKKEEYLIDKNGNKKWLLTSKLPMKDKSEKIIGLVGIGRDITDRKLSEEALHESEIKMKVILESTADGILAVDANGKVIKTNGRFAELWRIPKQLIDSGDDNALLEFVLEQLIDPDEFVSKVQKLYNSTEKDLDHLHFKDGRIFERFSAPLAMEGDSFGRVWSFRDITERVQFEKEIQNRNKELVKINAEKDKFFSIIAHDLKSPFNGLLGLTELMADTSEEFSPAQLIENMQSLNEAARKLYKLLDNLLEWAQVQKGSIVFTPIESELSKMVAQSIDTIYQRAKQKRITIISDIDSSLKIFADEKMISTVFRNLLSNAVKFTRKDGKVVVKSEKSGNGEIIVSVTDNGVGIPKSDIDRLFKIEEKVSTEGTDGETSTGLGLLLCKEFVEKNGGKIWVESQKNLGSTFYFTLPKV